MTVLLVSGTLIFGVITGLIFFGEGEFLYGVAGQIVHGLLSVICFALIAAVFGRFGWKVGLVLGPFLIVSNTALRFSRYLRRRRVDDVK
jgi:hypothetical protein